MYAPWLGWFYGELFDDSSIDGYYFLPLTGWNGWFYFFGLPGEPMWFLTSGYLWMQTESYHAPYIISEFWSRDYAFVPTTSANRRWYHHRRSPSSFSGNPCALYDSPAGASSDDDPLLIIHLMEDEGQLIALLTTTAWYWHLSSFQYALREDLEEWWRRGGL